MQDDLRGEILGRAAEGPRLVEHALGKAKVGDAAVPIKRHENVLGLEVSEGDVQRVQVLDAKHHLG